MAATTDILLKYKYARGPVLMCINAANEIDYMEGSSDDPPITICDFNFHLQLYKHGDPIPPLCGWIQSNTVSKACRDWHARRKPAVKLSSRVLLTWRILMLH